MSLVTSGLVILAEGRLSGECRQHDALSTGVCPSIRPDPDPGPCDLTRYYVHVVPFVDRHLVKCAKHFVKKGEGTLSPDDKPAKMPTRRKLQKVQGLDARDFDTRQVPERLDDALVLAVNDERAAALPVATSTHLAFAGTVFARIGDLGHIAVGVDRLEELDGFAGLDKRLDVRRNNEGDLLDLLDAVTTGEDQ